MWLDVLLFLLGIALLVKGSDFFVKAAADIAKKLGASTFVIGLTVVAIGTSLPELASSITAALKGSSGIVIGNVIGSNIANLTLIFGISAAVAAVKTKNILLRRDSDIVLFGALLFFVFILDGQIGILEEAIFISLYTAYIFYMIEHKAKRGEKSTFVNYLNYFFRLKYIDTFKNTFFGKKLESLDYKVRDIVKDVSILILGATAIFFGSETMIDKAILFANQLGLPEAAIGVTIVALGTSLPELSVTISAFKSGHGEMALGNILGSNIANTFMITGITGLLFPLHVSKLSLIYTAPFMILISFLIVLFIRSNWEISRREGIALVLLYFAFIAGLFFSVKQ